MRSIVAAATDADGVVHITDGVDDQLVGLMADARLTAAARRAGRALHDPPAARGERPPTRGGPLLLLAMVEMDGGAEFRS